MKRLRGRQMPWILALSMMMLSFIGTNQNSNSGYDSVTSFPDNTIQTQPKTLTVITTISPNTFYENYNGVDGLEFQLINTFAKKYNYQITLVLADKSDDVYNAVDQGFADIALIGQAMSISKQVNYPQTLAYMHSTSQLIYRAGDVKPLSFNDMAGKKIVVQNNEQNREKYRYLKSYYGDIIWEFSDESIENLLKLVNKGKIDFTVIDSHLFRLKENNFPKTRVAFDLYYPEPISLALSRNIPENLEKALTTFFTTSKSDGTLDHLIERFYGQAEDFDSLSSSSFHFLMRNRLPLYRNNIIDTSKEYQLDWRLLAAISFQESHWDPDARSKTGVRGMMMLTNDTAQAMGVTDRIDVDQSLRGGAKYFKMIYKDLPKSIKEPDRTWFALAAYNIGPAHLLDAQKITEFQHGNPNLWSDVKKSLLLLQDEEWHQFTKYGYARGGESVHYVQTIRQYYELLQTSFPNSDGNKLSNVFPISVKMLDNVLQEANTNGDKNIKTESKVASLLF